MTTVSAERLAKTLVEVSDTLVDEFDLIDFLHTLTIRAAELVAATAAGLLLANHHGRLEFVAASDENTRLLELFQAQSSEGPCLDAFRTGTPVVNADLSTATDRWPRFAPRATAAGYRSVHAFPLRLRNQIIGALNLFGTDTATTLDPTDAPIIQALADVATIALLQERAIRRGEILSEQLQGALNSRITIEQAKGAVAQANDITVDEAFTLLRDHARRTNSRLSDIAHAIFTHPAGVTLITPTDHQHR